MRPILERKYGDYQFATFLDFIITKHKNLHWKKFYLRCSYCDLQYSVIGRAETYSEDTKYILLKANLTSNIPLENADFRKHADYTNKDKKLTHEANGEPEARTLEYFKNINQTVIQTLYEMYKIDFELFNYNLHRLTR